MDFRDLAINLAKCESEDEVISLLTKENYWDNNQYWKPFGGNENNFSIIGNQQGAPDAALVEKLINSVDAVLLKECLIRKIDPESDEAPKSIPDALKFFYNIREGKISNLETRQRSEMSKNIQMIATGKKSLPNYIIYDKGEGQTPKKMPETILSLAKSNKLRVPFVQGKFNMGGTGVLQFCGDKNIQLIITKKCTQINLVDDKTKDEWGLTVIRRENPSNGRRSSMYTYLSKPDGSIMSFKADELKIIPVPSKENTTMEYGMFIKLFEYRIPTYKSNIQFDLYKRLSLLMPTLAHPVRLVECRDFTGHSMETTLSGLNIRLYDDRRNNVEKGYPTSLSFKYKDDTFNASIYVFKEDAKDINYRKDEGIIFCVNGQTQGSFSKAFFKRSTVNLSYLAKSLLIIVDCSHMDERKREDLFMNSRDRLRDIDMKRGLEKEFEEYLKNHDGLKALQEERRRKAISNHLSNEKPLADVLNSILKSSPTLSRLFIMGERLKNPFNLTDTNNIKEYNGEKYPTYFVLKHKTKKEIYTKEAPINHRFRIQFETDADNDYFIREIDPGRIELIYKDESYTGYGLNLFNGTATLTVTIPDDVKVNDCVNFEVLVTDDCNINEFREEFNLLVKEKQDYKGGGKGERKNPPGEDSNGNNKKRGGLKLPEITELYHEQWNDYDIGKDDVLITKGINGVYDFYINMDNIHLKTELKNIKDEARITLVKARYKYSMILIGLSIINYQKKLNDKEQQEDQVEETDIENLVNQVTKMISPIVLPLIEAMADLNMEDILDGGEITA